MNIEDINSEIAAAANKQADRVFELFLKKLYANLAKESEENGEIGTLIKEYFRLLHLYVDEKLKLRKYRLYLNSIFDCDRSSARMNEVRFTDLYNSVYDLRKRKNEIKQRLIDGGFMPVKDHYPYTIYNLSPTGSYIPFLEKYV